MKPEYLVFIREVAKTGHQAEAYRKAYPKVKSMAAARANASKLMCKPEIVEGIKRLQERSAKMAETQAAKELKDQIVTETLTAERKKEILREIAEGKALYKEMIPFYDENANDGQGAWVSKPVKFSQPTLADRIRAIEVHNKMTGDFAPDKLDHTSKGDKIGNTSIDFDSMPIEMLESLEKFIVHKTTDQ